MIEWTRGENGSISYVGVVVLDANLDLGQRLPDTSKQVFALIPRKNSVFVTCSGHLGRLRYVRCRSISAISAINQNRHGLHLLKIVHPSPPISVDTSTLSEKHVTAWHGWTALFRWHVRRVFGTSVFYCMESCQTKSAGASMTTYYQEATVRNGLMSTAVLAPRWPMRCLIPVQMFV
jgi:hypothetical protein